MLVNKEEMTVLGVTLFLVVLLAFLNATPGYSNFLESNSITGKQVYSGSGVSSGASQCPTCPPCPAVGLNQQPTTNPNSIMPNYQQPSTGYSQQGTGMPTSPTSQPTNYQQPSTGYSQQGTGMPTSPTSQPTNYQQPTYSGTTEKREYCNDKKDNDGDGEVDEKDCVLLQYQQPTSPTSQPTNYQQPTSGYSQPSYSGQY